MQSAPAGVRQPHPLRSEVAQRLALQRRAYSPTTIIAVETAAPFVAYLMRVRLQAAARLLRNSDLPVKSVAGAVDFASRSYFSQSVPRNVGADPTAYRFAAGADQDPESPTRRDVSG